MQKDPTIVHVIKETYNIRGEKITIMAPTRYDKRTGHPVFDETLDEKAINTAFKIYRQRHHLIAPTQIQGLCQTYGLSPSDLARLLGRPITTYVMGTLPNESDSILLQRLWDDPFQIQWWFLKNGESLSPVGRQAINSFLH